MLKLNKKGDEKYLSIWNFVIWALIGISIVIAVVVVNSSSADVRKLQAGSLAERIGNCIVSDGVIRSDFLNDNFDVFKTCNIDKSGFDSKLFYFNITSKKADGSDFRKEIDYGDINFEIMCGVKTNAESPNFAKCDSQSFSGIYNNEQITVSVMAGSNNIGGNI